MAEIIDPGTGYEPMIRINDSKVQNQHAAYIAWPKIDVKELAANFGYVEEIFTPIRATKKFVQHIEEGLEHWKANRR